MDHLKKLIRMHNPVFVAEPKLSDSFLSSIARKGSKPNFTSCNPVNTHIWIFWTSYITVSVSQVCEQSITSNVSLADGSLRIVLSVIYAKLI